jgi:feruloyl esterase
MEKTSMQKQSFVVLLALALQGLSTPAFADGCSALANLQLPLMHIDSAQPVVKGAPLVLWNGAQPSAVPHAFCRVKGTARPVSGSAIGFEVWLPEAVQWNGKFLQAGNGGFAGGVPVPALFDALGQGYASTGTDGGHQSSDGLDASWALNRPERIVDFGWRAVQQTTIAAKGIIKAYYEKKPETSYFVGCSNGGRDAMMVAQRFPEDFDGIVAGSPAIAWTGLMTGQALIQNKLAPPAALLPVSKLPLLQAAALEQCAAGNAYVKDPLACRFKPEKLTCKGADSPDCLTAQQVAVVSDVYNGIVNPGTGHKLYGMEPGAEAQPGNWDFWLLDSPTNPLGVSADAISMAEGFFRYFVRNDPTITLQDLTRKDYRQAYRLWHNDLNALDPDLTKFRNRGGKLLHYHGWNDSAVPPRLSLAYQDSVRSKMGDVDDFYRLYMVPGMNHCWGGAGPWQVNWLNILEAWVEKGMPPEAVTATDLAGSNSQLLQANGLPKKTPK